jgi:ubiquinone/menaquinone biosynthesis C-methylase UbiE
MPRLALATVLVSALLSALPAHAQNDDAARQVADERRQAELEGPALVELLRLQPGVTVADIGTGGGAMAIVLGRLVRSGRVYATDITPSSLATTRAYAAKEGLTNVTVVEGSAAATHLPIACCDALLLRNVYHLVAEPAAFNASLYATAASGARLAIIESPPRTGSDRPRGVSATVVIDELTAAGFVHVRTIHGWPPGGAYPTVFLALFEKR